MWKVLPWQYATLSAKNTCKNTWIDINWDQEITKYQTVMANPLSPVKNTRQTYNKQLEKVVTEVQVQFAEENPAWIPLETLLAMQKVQSA